MKFYTYHINTYLFFEYFEQFPEKMKFKGFTVPEGIVK